jgi:hypothetical protein
MRISSAVREFIESILHDELYVDRFRLFPQELKGAAW